MRYDSKLTGQMIGRLRVQRGWSQDVLSGLAGISRGHLSDIENGKKTPYLHTLWRITEALGLPLSDFIRLVEEEAERPAGGVSG